MPVLVVALPAFLVLGVAALVLLVFVLVVLADRVSLLFREVVDLAPVAVVLFAYYNLYLLVAVFRRRQPSLQY